MRRCFRRFMRAERDPAQQGEDNRQTCYHRDDVSLEHRLPSIPAIHHGISPLIRITYRILKYIGSCQVGVAFDNRNKTAGSL